MKFIRKLIFLILLIVVIIGLVFTIPGYKMYQDAVEKMPIEDKVASIKEQKKNYTEYDQLPKFYIDAVVAVEDHRFFEHNGIDFIGIVRAIYTNIKEKEFVEGGSTLTQQLAKNIYFTQEKTSKRKIAEAFMAAKLEEQCSKEQILELYANTSYFGDGYYTIKDACKGYFKKDIGDATKYECAMLAGLPNAPSVYAPTKNPDLAEQRTKTVLRKMVKFGYITEEEMDSIIEEE